MSNPSAGAVLSICHGLIMEARIIFVGLTAIYVAVLFMPDLLRMRDDRLFSTVLPLCFLVLYAAAAIFLINTTDSANALVHGLSVYAQAMCPR
jgi:hypothetical protein